MKKIAQVVACIVLGIAYLSLILAIYEFFKACYGKPAILFPICMIGMTIYMIIYD